MAIFTVKLACNTPNERDGHTGKNTSDESSSTMHTSMVLKRRFYFLLCKSMHWRATAHSARCTIKGITDVLPAFATRANSESVKRHDIMAVGVDRARDCSALFVFSAESTVYTSYSHRKLSRLVSATLLYGSCHASLQYAVGVRAAGKMTSRCRMSSSAPWCENIASALP